MFGSEAVAWHWTLQGEPGRGWHDPGETLTEAVGGWLLPPPPPTVTVAWAVTDPELFVAVSV